MYLAIQVRQNSREIRENSEINRLILQIERLAQLPGFRSWWSRQRRYFEFDLAFCRIIDEQVTAYSP